MTSAPHLTAETLAHAWAALLTQMADAVLLVDADGMVLSSSTRAVDLLGSAQAVVGLDVRRLFGLAPTDALSGPVELPGGRPLRLTATAIAPETGRTTATLLLLEAPPSPDDRPAQPLLERRLREVTLAISSALDIDEILDRVVRLSIGLLDADAGSLPLYDPLHDRLVPSYVVNLPAMLRPQYRGEGVVWEVINTGRSFRTNVYPADPRALSVILEQNVHATLCVPVVAGRQLLGVLVMYHSAPGKSFSARDQELLEIVGRQAGVAIQNARRYTDALRESARRTLMHKASVAFGSAVTTDELYVAMHRAAASLVRCDTCVIALLDAEREEVDYVYLYSAGRRWPQEQVALSRGLMGYVLRTGVSLRLTNSDDDVDAMFGAEGFGEPNTTSRSIIAVVLSAADKRIGAISVQCGLADAYTTDDLDTMESLAATAAIAIQNAQLFAKVQELATRDALTGVFNRRHFFELARRELERATRYPHPVSLLMIDADYFKQINDTYGHLAGDQVLQAIASRCRELLREVDVVARYGGEEFLVLLPETGLAAALQAAERVREHIGRLLVSTDAGPVGISVSIGVASYERDQLGSVERLLDQVDRALYEAKRAGRNQIRAYLDPAQEMR